VIAEPAASPPADEHPPPRDLEPDETAPTPLGSTSEITRRSTSPQLALFAVLLVAAMSALIWLVSRSEPELILTTALLIAALIDGISTARVLRRADVEVQNPIDAVAGHPVTYVVRVTGVNRPVELAPPPPLKAFGVTVVDDRPVYVTLPSPARGVVRFIVLDLHAGGPLGLFTCRRRVRVTFTTPLDVGPPPIPHEISWPYLHTVRMGLTPTSMHGRDLFRGVREYVPGDSRRDVHWSATAHHGQLMVKEHEGTGVISLRIIVTMPFFGLAADEATGRAAWLAEEGLRRGWEVHLVTVEAAELPEPPALVVRGTDMQSMFQPVPTLVHTVSQTVRSRAQVCRRLAAAVPGPVRLPGGTADRPGGRWNGPTRHLTPGGDSWE
jgi:uncharacterized protein (DUF58 family)